MRVCPQCNSLYGPDTTTCPRDGTATKDHVQVLIGQSLGPYVVKSVAGEGGMGVVYLGEHPAIGRKVALKVLRPELSLRDDLVDRFVQEARAVASIGHSNIVTIYDFGKTPFGTFYIVMEYLEGETLRDVLDREGPQPLARVLKMARVVGAGLAAAHAKGFVHRDVKPENIMLVRRAGKETMKLLDFGIAKLLTEQPNAVVTQLDLGMGTPQYMSPEQLDQSEVDSRADVYALAAVAYEMLTGSVPYPGRSAADVRHLQLTRSPPPPSVCRDDLFISRKFDASLLWGLNVDLNARCGSITDFVSTVAVGYASSTSPEALDVTRQHPLKAPARPRSFGLDSGLRLMALVLALVCLGAGGGAIAYLLTHRSAAKSGATAAQPGTVTPSSARSFDAGRPAMDPRRMVTAALRGNDTARKIQVIEMIGRVGRPVVEKLIFAALQDADPGVKRAAARTLGLVGSKRAIGVLARELKRSVGFTAVDVALALARLGQPAGRRRLRDELARAPDPYRRQYVLKALGSIGDPAAREWRAILKSKRLVDLRLRVQALGYLSRLGDKKARASLHDALTSDSWRRRLLAAEALMPDEPKVAADALAGILSNAPRDQKVRAAVLLAQLGDARALPVLLESLVKYDSNLRRDGALALGRLPTKKTRARLTDALGDSAPEVALAAAVALLER